jgi:hypothetical protein
VDTWVEGVLFAIYEEHESKLVTLMDNKNNSPFSGNKDYLELFAKGLIRVGNIVKQSTSDKEEWYHVCRRSIEELLKTSDNTGIPIVALLNSVENICRIPAGSNILEANHTVH